MMLPQEACGGWMPTPRKERLDSVVIAPPTRKDSSTQTGLIALGKISWKMI